MRAARAGCGGCRRATAGALLTLGVTGVLLAQTTGQIRGTVVDPAGLPLADVGVVVENPKVELPVSGTTTDAHGFFVLQGLPAADGFVVTLTHAGFARVVLTELRIEAGRPTQLRLEMRPDPTLRETIRVIAGSSVVALEETGSEIRLASEVIGALPIFGRDYQDTLTLAAGVTDVDGDGNPNVHGARDTSTITLMDGVSTTDPVTGKIGAQLNIESIQEIEIRTTGASAQYGRAQGGFVNIITKSGGNEIEGGVKFYWRGDELDGDGAGIDDPILHQGLGEQGLRDLEFDDMIGFLSLGGPIRRDRAWFFLSHETLRLEEPVNALNTAFVRGVDQSRDFLKLTWQATPNQRLAFSVNHDPQDYTNRGLNSFTRAETGYTDHQGGTLVSLKDTAILGPLVLLETTVSMFDGRPELRPTLDPDTNGNGTLSTDTDGNGLLEAREGDSGEDYDVDGAFDVFEDQNHNGKLDRDEDRDADGRVTRSTQGGDGACEGRMREDADCDGYLDFNEDLNANDRLDYGEDRDGDHHLDTTDEDRNGNNRLDDDPYPGADYPYGSPKPEPGDRDYTIDRLSRIVSGPFYQTWSDGRERFTFRQDLSVFVPESRGTHDVRSGFVLEREDFERDVHARPILAPRDFPECPKCKLVTHPGSFDRTEARQDTVIALVPTADSTHNEATAIAAGVYLQDTYKPLPNLSLGLGIRFDRETAQTSGYSYFEPAPEGALFEQLGALLGFERWVGDAAGNQDGVKSMGAYGDPLFNGFADPNAALRPFVAPLRVAAQSRLTRHHTEVAFSGGILAAAFPDIVEGSDIVPERLVAHGILPQVPEHFTLTNNNLMPRLALSWDPWSSGRAKFFLTWGRYYDRLFLSTVVAEQGPDRMSRYYLLDPSGWNGVPNHRLGDVLAKSPPSTTQIDRSLQTPFSDEFTAGFEQEIAPDVALSLVFIDRKFRQQLQDVDVNHALRFDDTTGSPLDLIGDSRCQLGNTIVCNIPGSDGLPDLYIHNPFFNEVLRIGNFNEARYKAITLEIVRHQSRRWEMRGSYTYSRAVGSAEDFQSRLGNDPSLVESEFGYLDYDQRHVVKVHGAMFLPRDWRTGFSATWGSGLPFSVLTRSFQLDSADYPQFRTRYGAAVTGLDDTTLEFASRRRNSERNASVFNFDLRVEKAFVLGRAAASLSFEVFNLLNSDDLRIYSYQPIAPDLFTEDDASAGAQAQIDAERRFGRRFQIGFQIGF